MRKGQKMPEELKQKLRDVFKTRNYTGENNPKWRGGRVKMTDGRILVYAPNHPFANCMKGTHILEYRLIAEAKIGRYLLPTEVVHHIDGDISNNHPDNLEVITQAEHAKKHVRPEDIQKCKDNAIALRKLTMDQAGEIRARHKNKESMLSISRDYPVSYQTITQIIAGNYYK